MCTRNDGITEYFTIYPKNRGITPLNELKEATVNKQLIPHLLFDSIASLNPQKHQYALSRYVYLL